MDERFANVNERFARVDERFDIVDRELKTITDRLDVMDKRFDLVEGSAQRSAMNWSLGLFVPASMLGGLAGAIVLTVNQRRSVAQA